MFVFFCGFFRGFQRFGVFFELGFHSGCIRQKREFSPNVDWSDFFWPGENKLHHRKAMVRKRDDVPLFKYLGRTTFIHGFHVTQVSFITQVKK